MSSSKPTNGSKIVSKGSLRSDEAKWTKLTKINWQDPTGKDRVWECAERSTRSQGGVDAVEIIAILKEEDGPKIVLGKQYRPPCETMCIEFPAGLIDEGEEPEKTGVRELLEETGYHGKATEMSYLMFNDPGFTNTNMKCIFCDVDMEDKRNQNPKPQLDEGEYIETFKVPLANLYDELKRLESEGYALDARVASFALGLEAAKKYGL